MGAGCMGPAALEHVATCSVYSSGFRRDDVERCNRKPKESRWKTGPARKEVRVLRIEMKTSAVSSMFVRAGIPETHTCSACISCK
mgnify:CR=1 FL=1